MSIAAFGLSAAIAVFLPRITRHLLETRVQATAADLDRFGTLFKTYAREQGDWPAGTTTPGQVPNGMTAALAATNWEQRSPIGGRYVWLTNTVERGERVRAAIAIVGTNLDPVSDDKRALDLLLRQFDGGNRSRMRLGFQNQPLFVLEH